MECTNAVRKIYWDHFLANCLYGILKHDIKHVKQFLCSCGDIYLFSCMHLAWIVDGEEGSYLGRVREIVVCGY